MLQHESLKFLGGVAAGSPGQQGHQSVREQIQEGQHHQTMIRTAADDRCEVRSHFCTPREVS
jgi:hypothetical protein